jgi:hypothetical protein
MTKKKQTRARPKRESKGAKISTTETKDAREEDTRNEYGGMPLRDLKKNLGCG